ncbi:unnamed protein product [Penicillium manginii]
MNLLQTSADPEWDKVTAIDDAQDENEPERPRKKRRKYIARACNECKRRKIKCNGQAPCQRCGRQRLECVYVENAQRDSLSEHEYVTFHY